MYLDEPSRTTRSAISLAERRAELERAKLELADITINQRKWCVRCKLTALYLLIEDNGKDCYVTPRHHSTGFPTKRAAIEACQSLGLTSQKFEIEPPLIK